MRVPDAVPPAQIGPYQIVETLGRGGMGTVYRARDPRLGRDVAVKVVELTDDGTTHHAERLLAETRAAGRLQHPNVMAVLDVGVHDGRPYMVSEFIAGGSLRAELDRGRMPRARALDVATQIVAGLAAAHQAPLVHRDLKPENVMITAEGVVKIVDFGLAKSLAPVPPDDTAGPTLTAPHAIVGSAPYMSPEQARGASTDTRSDQFSFGCVLFEMLSGRRAFDRPTPVETLAAILKEEPEPLAALDPTIPPPLRWIVERCLAKSPDERYASTLDLWHDLKTLGARAGTATPVEIARPTARPRWRVALGAAALAAAAGWLAATRPIPPTAPALPSWHRLTYEQGFVDAARFGADGQTVIYSAAWDNAPFAVFSTTIASPESRRLDLPPAGILAVAPSGELALSLGCSFVAASGTCPGTLARAPMHGGAPREIVADIRTADWGPDGTLALARRDETGLLSVEYPAGTRLSGRGSGYVRIAPDGARVAWTESAGSNSLSVVVRDADTTRTLATGWRFISGLAWTRDSGALYVSGVGPDTLDDAVIRLALDGSSRVALRGAARLRVLDAGSDGRLLVSATNSPVRLLAWGPGPPARPRDLTWLGNTYLDAIAEDGRRLLFTVRAGAALEFAPDLYPIYVRDLDGGPATRLGSGYGVALSPDGRWALTRTRPAVGPSDLVLVPLGPGEPRTLPRGDIDTGSANTLAVFVGPDRLALRGRVADGPWRTFVQRLDGGLPQLVAHEPGEIVSPVAPDHDRFIARRSDGSRWIARLSADGGDAVAVSIRDGVSVLQWTADGRGLVLARADGLRNLVSRLDLASGRESPLREVDVHADAGFVERRGFTASRNGTVVAGSEIRVMGALYLVEGVQ